MDIGSAIILRLLAMQVLYGVCAWWLTEIISKISDYKKRK